MLTEVLHLEGSGVKEILYPSRAIAFKKIHFPSFRNRFRCPAKQMHGAEAMRDICGIFSGVDDPRRGNATRRDLQGTLVTAFPRFLSGGRNCADMER